MAHKYDLSWKEVYEVESEFQSLIRAEKIKKDNLEKTIQKLKFTHTQAAKVELKQVEEQAQMMVHKRYGGSGDP